MFRSSPGRALFVRVNQPPPLASSNSKESVDAPRAGLSPRRRRYPLIEPDSIAVASEELDIRISEKSRGVEVMDCEPPLTNTDHLIVWLASNVPERLVTVVNSNAALVSGLRSE